MICILLPIPFGRPLKQTVKTMGFIFSALLIIVVIFLTINVLQRGLGDPDGRTVAEILGTPGKDATKADLEKLSKSELMQLFYAASAPDKKNMNGEFHGRNLPVGISFPIIKYIEVNMWGPPGDWVGKRFRVCKKAQCPGVNLFDVDMKNGKGRVKPSRKMSMSIRDSVFDDKTSLVLDYEQYNEDITRRIVDEIRQINPNLFIGQAYVKFPPGTWHCFPFVMWREN